MQKHYDDPDWERLHRKQYAEDIRRIGEARAYYRIKMECIGDVARLPVECIRRVPLSSDDALLAATQVARELLELERGAHLRHVPGRKWLRWERT